MSFYNFLKKYLGAIVKSVYRVKVTGAENEPVNGAFLICPNHVSNADAFIVGASVKSRVTYFAKKELFAVPLVKQFITAVGAFPVDRGGNDIGAIKKAINLLESGRVLVLYPQGTRCPGVDPRQTAIKHGAALIARRANVPVLPVCIQSKGFRTALFRRTYVRIGKPIYPEELNAATGGTADYKKAADYIFGKITDMIE